MEMKDEIRLEASREAVWAALNNPDILKICIPGCESLEKVSDTEFVSLVVVKVGPIKAKFTGKVTLNDIVPLTSYRLIGEGQGGVAGFAKSDIVVELISESMAVTVLRYGVNANIGGKIAQLGSRLIDSTARKMADQFFASFSAAVCLPIKSEGLIFSADTNVSSTTITSDHILVRLVDLIEEPGLDWANISHEVADPNRGFGNRLTRLFGFVLTSKTKHTPVADPKPTPNYRAAIVTLNRPKQRNAVSLAMWRDLATTFEQLGKNSEVRAIILTGASGNFSAGADITEFPSVRATVEQGVEYEVAVDRCCDAIAATPKPTIAVVNGYCIGGACHLAMSCDFRIVHPKAQFAIPAARLSIVYGVRATQRLLALVGLSQAKRILYSAKKFGGVEACRIGFASHTAIDPMRTAQSFAAGLADNAPLTISGTKVLLNGLVMGLGTLNDSLINQVIERAVASDDYRDATIAFVEKRQPVFLGR